MNITYFVSFFCDELLFIQPEFCAPITPNPNDVTETDRQTDRPITDTSQYYGPLSGAQTAW